MSISYDELKRQVLEAARRYARQGPGYSQQRPVLDEVSRAASTGMFIRPDLNLEQAILTCWHDLFREGTLSWGYNLDNPGPPFFHIPERPDPQ